MKILYCDDHLIVCIKPAGAVSTDEPGGMPGLIRQALGEDRAVRTVHRLDSVVSGLMVYALTKEAASGLSDQMEDGTFGKEYLAVVEGRPEKDQGQWKDYLSRNKRERKTYVSNRKDRNAQEAILTYRTCGKGKDVSLVKVKLMTGRTHQIRCQFSSRSLPLYGDRKYGSAHSDAKIALWSHHLSFRHPVTGKKMDFAALPPTRIPWTFFRGWTEKYEDGDLEVEFQRSETFSDCPYAEDCGFCAYQGMEYEKQLEKKERKSSRWIRDLGPVDPILPMEEPFGYRNKVTVDFGTDRNGRLVTGVYSRKAHRVLRIGRCRIDHPKLAEILGTLRSLVIRREIPIFDEVTGEGWLRQATLRISTEGEVMVVLSGASDPDQQIKSLAEELRTAHPEVKVVLVKVLKKGKGRGETFVLTEEDSLSEHFLGQSLRLGADSSFAMNPAQSEKVYELALEYAGLTGEERVLDVSCGVGVLALAAAARAKRVLAVEVSEASVREAAERAKAAKAENVRFVAQAPEAYLEALARSREELDVVFVEASRCRSSAECVAAIGRMKPKRVVYIGRDPEGMGRELHSLAAAGYRMERARSVDVMPFAEQAETVVSWGRSQGVTLWKRRSLPSTGMALRMAGNHWKRGME